jgi:hypothetical protein
MGEREKDRMERGRKREKVIKFYIAIFVWRPAIDE